MKLQTFRAIFTIKGRHFLFFWFTKSADPKVSKIGIKIKLLLLIIIFIFFADPRVLVVQKLKKK